MSKRIFDLILSIFGLIILIPIILVIIFFVKFSSKGPIIFKQKRVGQFGKIFTIYKFRTMYINDNKNTISVLGDKRITPIGKFLRRYKLDEVPELLNILVGNMSFVGPRPDVPGYADKLEGDDRKILLLKPGITGPATLKYANEEDLLSTVDDPVRYNDEVLFPDKVKLNLEYLENQSLLLDLKIIINTIIRKY